MPRWPEHQMCSVLSIVDLLHGMSGTSSESEMSSQRLGTETGSTVCPERISFLYCRKWHWTRTSWSAFVQVLLPKIS